MLDVEKIANEADVIINGFAVKKEADGYHVFDLNNLNGVAVFKEDGVLIETNMDDIELAVAKNYLLSSLTYIEDVKRA